MHRTLCCQSQIPELVFSHNQPPDMKRRTFIQYSAAAGAAYSIGGFGCRPTLTGSDYSKRIGLQLYTVRNGLEKDFEGTIKKVAESGYREIELFMPNMLDEHVPVIRDFGMTVVSTHFMPGYISDKWGPNDQRKAMIPENFGLDDIIEACTRNGLNYAGVPVLFEDERENADDYRRFADLLNIAGEKFKQAGLRLFYHNHSFEFAPMEGIIPMQILADRLDADLVCIELDVFWTAVAGHDPIAWIEKLSGKVDLLHLKDIAASTPVDLQTFGLSERMPDIFLPVGKGILAFPAMLDSAHKSGVMHCFVEQDVTTGDIFEDIAFSANYLKKTGK